MPIAASRFLTDPLLPSFERSTLPSRTSRYNLGNYPGRYADASRKPARFALKRPTPLYDGSGRQLGTVSRPVRLNIGAVKRMDLDGDGKRATYVWAWQTSAGSGWIRQSALERPPPVRFDPKRNPKPPRESAPVVVDTVRGRARLKDLKFPNSKGVIPRGGNAGEHYAGRKPGPLDHVYVLFNVPNVTRGGVAKDSLKNGGRFVPALDAHGRLIRERMTMYRDGDRRKPVPVHFVYGRAERSRQYGWIAQANLP